MQRLKRNHGIDGGRLRAGDPARESGIYRAYHRMHRMPHNVYIAAGTRLPVCQRCGRDVEFALLMSGPGLEADYDFSTAEREEAAA